MSFEQLKDLDVVLESIDAKQRLLNSAKVSEPGIYERLLDAWAVESTYNSNRIEGSTLSLGDTALVFEGAKIDAPESEIAQAVGGQAAINLLLEYLDLGMPLTVRLIKELHNLVYAEAKKLENRGEYRTSEVEITGTPFIPTPAAFVPERMEALVASINQSTKHPAITAALFHLEFESIHPFVNGNGRTGRLVSNYILMLNGYEPVNIQAHDRARYIEALREFQLNDDPYPFVALFVKALELQIGRFQECFAGKNRNAETDTPMPSAVISYLSEQSLKDKKVDSSEAEGGKPKG